MSFVASTLNLLLCEFKTLLTPRNILVLKLLHLPGFASEDVLLDDVGEVITCVLGALVSVTTVTVVNSKKGIGPLVSKIF